MTNHPDVLDEMLGDLVLEIQENILNRLDSKSYDIPGDIKKDIQAVSKAKQQILESYVLKSDIEKVLDDNYA